MHAPLQYMIIVMAQRRKKKNATCLSPHRSIGIVSHPYSLAFANNTSYRFCDLWHAYSISCCIASDFNMSLIADLQGCSPASAYNFKMNYVAPSPTIGCSPARAVIYCINHSQVTCPPAHQCNQSRPERLVMVRTAFP